ncbi:2TM domain-containing protein [Lutibacter sp. B1]|uniref:2TM domain-containing protein n=1 Tax=Lutibacter sp. B1 TaxID=2725996 RepID=UPI001FFD2604|nr:2TM domain-containing protein [Lutibacter sp. B1]
MRNQDFKDEDRYLRAEKKVKQVKGFYLHLFWYVLINVSLLVMIYINLNADEEFFQWEHFATPFFWGIGLGFHWLGVFGKNFIFSKDWEERKIKEFMEKDKHEFWE